MDDVGFVRALPKAELHAHLNGSIRPSTLTELLRAHGGAASSADAMHIIERVLPSPTRSLHECFAIFGLIHSVVRDIHTLQRITREMIEDCAADNVTYLEIRTTPKPMRRSIDDDASTASIRHYMIAVVEAIREMERRDKRDILVKLVLSINRTMRVEEAQVIVDETIQLMSEPLPSEDAAAIGRTYGHYIVGMELSGDPTRGDAAVFFPCLRRAREAGLKISMHCAEVMNVKETLAVLDFKPDRLGHMCVLTPGIVAQLIAMLQGNEERESKGAIPVEICPTSNALTLHLPSLRDHPTLSPWLENHYPFAICTDDSGVFNVTLSDEIVSVMETYKLSREGISKLALQAFEYAFCSEAEKTALLEVAAGRAAALLAT